MKELQSLNVSLVYSRGEMMGPLYIELALNVWGILIGPNARGQGSVADRDRGFVEFDYHGLHKELVRNRITPDDVRWAAALIGGLSERQWRDAFRAGGYPSDLAMRFIDILRGRVSDAQRVDLSATR